MSSQLLLVFLSDGMFVYIFCFFSLHAKINTGDILLLNDTVNWAAARNEKLFLSLF